MVVAAIRSLSIALSALHIHRITRNYDFATYTQVKYALIKHQYRR